MGDAKTCILVVDDEAVDLALVQHALEAVGGFTLLIAMNYESALEVFDGHAAEVSLLITDVSLPGRSGVELAKALLSEKPHLKVLFTSGWAGAERLAVYGIPLTDRHFLAKPFEFSDLIARVREILASPDSILGSESEPPRAAGESGGA